MQSSQDSVASRLLREGREAASIEIEAASQLTRIPQEMIRALEEGRWDALPGAAYARAFARTLAGAYGIDPEAVVSALRRDMNDVPDPPPQRQPTPQARLQTPANKLDDVPKDRSSGPFLLLGALALALLLLIGLTRIDDISPSPAPSAGAIDSVPDTTARLQADTARIDTAPAPAPRHVAISIRDTGSAFLLYIRAGRVRKSTLGKGDSLAIDPDTTSIFRNLSNYSLYLSGAVSKDSLGAKYFRIERVRDTARLTIASEAEWKVLYDRIMERRRAKSARDGN